MPLTKELLLESCRDIIPVTGRMNILELSQQTAEMYKQFVEPEYFAKVEKQSEMEDRFGFLDKSKYHLLITKPQEVAC